MPACEDYKWYYYNAQQPLVHLAFRYIVFTMITISAILEVDDVNINGRLKHYNIFCQKIAASAHTQTAAYTGSLRCGPRNHLTGCRISTVNEMKTQPRTRLPKSLPGYCN